MSDKTPTKFYQIELRELEPLLRKKLGDELKVIDFCTEFLLSAGENYGSTMFKVHVIIKRRQDAENEKLDLVAKMQPPTDFQRMIFDSSYTFRKESFFYEELIPSYQKLEQELGVKNEEIFNIVPEYFGSRFSLKNNDCFDDDAVILMQNLQVLGYYTGNRQEGLDFEHAKMAITSLSHFHALGMAMKQHKPDYFEILKTRSKCLTFEEQTFEDSHERIMNVVCEDPEISDYESSLRVAYNQESAWSWTALPPESWGTIVHSDFWVNNIMFHKNSESNQIDDVKFVDFQNYLYLSPMRELVFLLMGSTNAEVMEHRFDELLNLYYNTFIEKLNRLKVNTEPFARDKFDERLKIDAYEEFPHCPYMLKIMTTDVNKDEKFDCVDKLMQKEKVTDKFRQRLRRCIKKFIEKGWISKPN